MKTKFHFIQRDKSENEQVKQFRNKPEFSEGVQGAPRTTKAWLVSGILVFVIISFAFTNCSRDHKDRATTRPVAVRVVKPVITDIESRLSYMGTVHANSEVNVIARVQGTVLSLPKAEGARVNQGDLVAELDVLDLNAIVERLQVDLDYWNRRYESDKRLVEAEALPSEQAEASRRAFRTAKAALAEAEAKLAKAKEFSPIRGRVLSWLAEPGQHLMPGQPILLLGNDDLEIHVEVVEEDLRRGVKVDISVNVLGWQGNKFQSRVSEVSPIASGPARAFTVRIPVPKNEAEDIRIGASMRMDFVLKSSLNCVALPVEAISQEGGRPHIFLIIQNIAKKQRVTVGIEQEGLVEVTFPWNGKDLVAISNLSSLSDGTPVFPVEAKEVRK